MSCSSYQGGEDLILLPPLSLTHITLPYLTLLCPLLTTPINKHMFVQKESDCFSSVPTKSPGSSPESHRKPTELTRLQATQENFDKKQQQQQKTDAKCLPVTQTLSFLVQTSSCNFILESLWIPGTSILRYIIYRLNYGSKPYQYVKILYVQLNCSMLLSALGGVCPPFCRMIMQMSVDGGYVGFCFITTVRAEASWPNRQGDVWVREDLFYCVLYSYLDCRRLVKHENVPSNFQAPLSVCVYV